jgi:hypothetical protein
MSSEKTNNQLDEIGIHPLDEKAAVFVENPKLLSLLNQAFINERIRATLAENPESLITKAGIQLPPGLRIEFIMDPKEIKPIPNRSFEIRFTQCRTFWVKETPDSPPKQQTICFGIQVTPILIPPIGRL